MNARLISKMVIVAGMFFFLVWIGVKAGRCAEKLSADCESRYVDAVKVLQDN